MIKQKNDSKCNRDISLSIFVKHLSRNSTLLFNVNIIILFIQIFTIIFLISLYAKFENMEKENDVVGVDALL